METGGIENSIDVLTEEVAQLREVMRSIGTEIVNLNGCLIEFLLQIRSDNQTGKACGCSKEEA
ncbi:MAG: hypothetical protein ACOYL3_16385 [Desulfuromonadaceae bacterium]